MFINKSKEQRARSVIASPKQFDEESVERKALALGQAEKLEGDELVKFVYVKLGGALEGETSKKELPSGTIAVESIGKEKEALPAPGRRARK